MASVPAKYIKQKEIDFDGEIFDCLGLTFCIAGIEVKPVTIGVLSLLEIIDSKIVNDVMNADAMDFCRALYISSRGRSSAEEVREWVKAGGKEPHEQLLPWDITICKFADEHKLGEIGLTDLYAFRNFLLQNSFNGYEMIPSTDGGSYMPYLFGAETIASMMLTCGITDINKVLWEIPVCLVGHMAAVNAKRNGVRGVSRPKDEQDRLEQLRQAEAREIAGELHPWQIQEPDNPHYGITETQMKARPEIKDEFNKILKAFLRAKRQQVKSNG